MSRRSKSRSTRDRNQIANLLRSPFSYPSRQLPNLTSFEDFRRWEPELTDDRYPRLFSSPRPRVPKPKLRRNIQGYRSGGRSLAMPKLFMPVPTGMGFSSPIRVVLCARRAIRKQVLHAFRQTGRGGQSKPRITQNSLIHC